MHYTKALSAIISDNGAPTLSPSSFARIMNIVHLEGKINGLKRAAQKMKSSDEPRKFELDIFSLERQLTDLTGNVEPTQFLLEVCRG